MVCAVPLGDDDVIEVVGGGECLAHRVVVVAPVEVQGADVCDQTACRSSVYGGRGVPGRTTNVLTATIS